MANDTDSCIEVYSGVEALVLGARQMVDDLRLERPIAFVLDAPWGYALKYLSSIGRPALVVTGNLSPHYLRDLLDLGPAGLIASTAEQDEIIRALGRVAKGEKFYSGPPLQTDPLALRERQTLRLVAFGLDNSEIAEVLGISKQSVANIVSGLRDKLGVRNRVEMALQYLGVLQPLSVDHANPTELMAFVGSGTTD